MSSQHMAETTIQTRQIDRSQQDKFIQDFLRPCLPYSLPLLRRCQFHQRNATSAGSAEIWLATASDEALTNPKEVTSLPWLAAHIDLTNSGQTQVWLFASWEAEFANSEAAINPVRESPRYPIYEKLMVSLFDHLRDYHIPKLPQTPPAPWLRLKEGGKILSIPYSRSKVLFGTIAESLWPFLDDYGPPSDLRRVTREDRPYFKYVITNKLRSVQQVTTPDGLHFAQMPQEHLQTIIDRTNIPRTIETVRQCPSVGLFDDKNVPVAWGLLGKDGSLSSLHTEPEYRRKGLAVAVATKLIVEQVGIFPDASEEEQNPTVYTDADVSPSNRASRNVMEKLGGKVLWRVAWIEIDVGEQAENH